MGFTYRDFYTVNIARKHTQFLTTASTHIKTLAPRGNLIQSDYSNLGGSVLEGPLGSSRGEVFHIIWGLLQGYGWLKEVGGHGNCIKEPANVMSCGQDAQGIFCTSGVTAGLTSLGAEADGPLYRRPLCCLHINLTDGQRPFSQWWRPFTEYSIFPKVS